MCTKNGISCPQTSNTMINHLIGVWLLACYGIEKLLAYRKSKSCSTQMLPLDLLLFQRGLNGCNGNSDSNTRRLSIPSYGKTCQRENDGPRFCKVFLTFLQYIFCKVFSFHCHSQCNLTLHHIFGGKSMSHCMFWKLLCSGNGGLLTPSLCALFIGKIYAIITIITIDHSI